VLRELNNLFRTLSSKFHLTLHSHTNAEHWAYVEKLIENGTMGYQAKELTRISAPTFDLRGAYCFLVSLASLHSTIPLIVLYRSASSRIGAALVVEPSLTLIIGKFGYLG
jgi:hypothetical protein